MSSQTGGSSPPFAFEPDKTASGDSAQDRKNGVLERHHARTTTSFGACSSHHADRLQTAHIDARDRLNLEHPVRRVTQGFQNGEGDIVDWHTLVGSALGRPSMGVAVHHKADIVISVDGLRQS